MAKLLTEALKKRILKATYKELTELNDFVTDEWFEKV